MTQSEAEMRTTLALDAIKQALGTEADEYGATLFVKHHLEEMPKSYWERHLGTATPQQAAVIGLLELRSHWGEDELENFDFTLPDDATNYVVSVHFDNAGQVDGISMES